ncbi:MAG: ATP-binding protein, partial [Polyangiales bacterium]
EVERQRAEILLERFKRENAVLRNSLRYLPTVASEIDAVTRSETGAQLGSDVDSLVRDLLLLQSFLDETVLERVDATLGRLRTQADAPTLLHAAALPTLLAHAGVVREHTPVVNTVTRQILALSTVQRTEAMSAIFARAERRALRATDVDTRIVFALALAVLCSAATSIIVRQRRSAQALRQTSTRLAHAVDALRAEQAKQRELADLKSKFVSMTSHEFRTPVSVIVSSSEMLSAYAERWSEEKKAEHLVRIRTAGQNMTRMLDAILLIGRSDAGMLKFEPRTLDVHELCAAVLEDVADGTKEGNRVRFEPAVGTPEVLADENLLKHILENLLSNALKYSQSDRPVRFEVAQRNGALSFSIADQGIGIPEQDRARLFETFHRGSNVGKVSGTGLGLAIVKRAVDLHGGSLSLESRVGEGTRFTVTIPSRGETT